MSHSANQARIFLRLLGQLRPHWHREPGLPARIQALLARQRSFGARDRRLYRELIYTTLRYLPWVEPHLDAQPGEAVRRVAWLAAELPATKTFRAAFATGEPPTGDKSELLPAWFRGHRPEIFYGAELEAQLRRAPLWLRLQTSEPKRIFAEFEDLGWTWRASDVLPSALQLLGDVDVTKTEAFRRGQVEIQDLGSQLILASAHLAPNAHWLDACAGAGGKTLQLAALLGPGGRVDAHDIRPAALGELAARATRAGLGSRIQIVRVAPDRVYDGVLVDAPCSGSGTWRRAPHLKWTTSEATIARAAGQQLELLTAGAIRVRAGGRLIYATCSLSRREDEDVVAAFLSRQPEFEAVGPGQLILPSVHDTDGFFVATLRRK